MGVQQKMRRRLPAGGAGRFKIKHETIASQQADLLRRVRAEDGLSRVELARSLNLAPSTVGIYVDHLVEEGFLFEGKAAARDFGRPPTILALNPQGGRFIGVDFEARNIMAVAVDFSQRPLKELHSRISAEDTVEDILRKIERAIEAAGAGDDRKVLAIGVGVPGVIDPEHGVALDYKHIKGWRNVPLVERLSERFGIPVYLENNIRTMALAELWFGQGRGVRDFICFGVRSGVGAGIVMDGQIYHGADNRAGEIGEWPCNISTFDGNGAQISTNGIARLEEITSFRSVQHRIAASTSTEAAPEEAAEGDMDLRRLVKAAHAGDGRILAILDRVARTFGLVLNQLNCAFNPEKIILAGAFTEFGDPFLGRVNESLRAFAPRAGAPIVVNSKLGEFNGALGAAALAVHQWKPLPAKAGS